MPSTVSSCGGGAESGEKGQQVRLHHSQWQSPAKVKTFCQMSLFTFLIFYHADIKERFLPFIAIKALPTFYFKITISFRKISESVTTLK